MKAIFKREFKSYFATPLGWVFLAIYYLALGIFFKAVYSYGSSDLSSVILSMVLIVTFTVPAITMRLFSDERSKKIDQVLFTAPVKLSSIVLGKFFAALAIFALGFAPTLIFQVIIWAYVKVNIIAFLYSLLGILLLGSALIAIGMFISSLTESVALSAFVILIVDIFLIFADSLITLISNSETAAKIASKIAFLDIVSHFGTPVLSVPDIVFFLSITAAFIFLCTQSLEKRRWS